MISKALSAEDNNLYAMKVVFRFIRPSQLLFHFILKLFTKKYDDGLLVGLR